MNHPAAEQSGEPIENPELIENPESIEGSRWSNHDFYPLLADSPE